MGVAATDTEAKLLSNNCMTRSRTSQVNTWFHFPLRYRFSTTELRYPYGIRSIDRWPTAAARWLPEFQMEPSNLRGETPRNCDLSEARASDRPRYRTISFRLSEEDYQQLRVLLDARRITSISALTRVALSRLKRTSAGRVSGTDGLAPVAGLIDDLDSAVKRVSALLSRRNAPRTGSANRN